MIIKNFPVSCYLHGSLWSNWHFVFNFSCCGKPAWGRVWCLTAPVGMMVCRSRSRLAATVKKVPVICGRYWWTDNERSQSFWFMFKPTWNLVTPIFFHHYKHENYNFVPIIRGLSYPLAIYLCNDTISVDVIVSYSRKFAIIRCRIFSNLLSKNIKIKIYRTIILPVVLYGCETWSLTLREERRLRVFENRG
jgi:hypothetical protein